MQMLLTFNLHPAAATICSVVVARGAGLGSTWPPPRWGQHYPFKTTTTPLTGFVSLDEGSQSHSIHTQYHRTQYYSLICIYYGILQNDNNDVVPINI